MKRTDFIKTLAALPILKAIPVKGKHDPPKPQTPTNHIGAMQISGEMAMKMMKDLWFVQEYGNDKATYFFDATNRCYCRHDISTPGSIYLTSDPMLLTKSKYVVIAPCKDVINYLDQEDPNRRITT